MPLVPLPFLFDSFGVHLVRFGIVKFDFLPLFFAFFFGTTFWLSFELKTALGTTDRENVEAVGAATPTNDFSIGIRDEEASARARTPEVPILDTPGSLVWVACI